MRKYLNAGTLAACGVVLFVIGNELMEPILRRVLEVLAGVMAFAGVVLDRPQGGSPDR
jgi:hypothetical protein